VDRVARMRETLSAYRFWWAKRKEGEYWEGINVDERIILKGNLKIKRGLDSAHLA